jgi:hypothetical protein
MLNVAEQDEQFGNRFELFNQVLKVIGNILFVIACFILVWKGMVYLFDYFFPPSSHSATNIAVRSSVSKLYKYPALILGIIAVLLFVVRIVVMIKLFISPFQILSIIGMAILVKKLWEIAFSKDSASYLGFLKEFGKKIFE